MKIIKVNKKVVLGGLIACMVVFVLVGVCSFAIVVVIDRNKILEQNQQLIDEQKKSSQLQETEETEGDEGNKENEENLSDPDDECDTYHLDDYDWIPAIDINNSGAGIVYTEVNSLTGILCTHLIFDRPKDKLIQSPNLHRWGRKVSFFLKEPDWSDDSANFVVIDLEKGKNGEDAVFYSDVVVELGMSHSIIYSTCFSFDRYIVIFPVDTSGCGANDPECEENALEAFKTEWEEDKIVILDLEGKKYEIPGTELPYHTRFLFDTTVLGGPSEMTLIAFEVPQTGYNIIKTYDLGELLK